MKILIAEDDLFSQKTTGFLLKDWGYEYDIADNGLQAVELAEKNQGKYDLCLMDIDMPIMNGYDATRIMRQKTRYLPILGLSSNLDLEYLYQEAGMDDFLDKSYDLDELHGKIKELTVKYEKVEFKNKKLYIRKEMPMDQRHAQELRELAKNNLRKVKLFDSPGSTVIVHKNVTKRISHDFNIKKQFVSIFLNRDPEKPTRCELYKNTNYLMPQTFLMEEEIDDTLKEEDQDLEKYQTLELKESEE